MLFVVAELLVNVAGKTSVTLFLGLIVASNMECFFWCQLIGYCYKFCVNDITLCDV